MLSMLNYTQKLISWVGGRWLGWLVVGLVGGRVGWWLKFMLILRLSQPQPSLAGVGAAAGAELGNSCEVVLAM